MNDTRQLQTQILACHVVCNGCYWPLRNERSPSWSAGHRGCMHVSASLYRPGIYFQPQTKSPKTTAAQTTWPTKCLDCPIHQSGSRGWRIFNRKRYCGYCHLLPGEHHRASKYVGVFLTLVLAEGIGKMSTTGKFVRRLSRNVRLVLLRLDPLVWARWTTSMAIWSLGTKPRDPSSELRKNSLTIRVQPYGPWGVGLGSGWTAPRVARAADGLRRSCLLIQ